MALTDNLSAWWNLDEASGNRLDSSGNSKTLTDNDTVGQAAGKIGNAATFNGSSEHLSRADAIVSSGALTLACWVYPTSIAADSVLIGQGNSGSGMNQAIVHQASGNVMRVVCASAELLTATGLTANTWTHLVATFAAGAIRLYINGALDAGWPQVSTADYTGIDIFELGHDPKTSRYLTGRLDLCGVWNRALSAAEVTSLYNAGAGLDPTAVVAVQPVQARSPAFCGR